MAEKLIQLVSGFSGSRVLYTFTELGVVDILASAGSAMTAEEIAAKLGPEYKPQPLFRLLRLAASLGLLDMHDGQLDTVEYEKTCKFDLNDTSQLLRDGAPQSLRPMVLWRGGDVLYKLWGGLGESVKTGESASAATLGADMWQYLQQNPEANEHFNQAMSANTGREVGQVLGSYDFSEVTSVADIGGGLGTQLFAILKHHPHIKKGHLFEIPSVIEKVVVPDDLKHRVELHAGSFLDAEATGIPAGADLYLLKHIIHDWADPEALQILKATRKAMPAHAKLLVGEYVVPRGNGPSFAKSLDIHMMVVVGAKERTEEEYRQLLKSAGLDLTRVLGQPPHINLVEAQPASSM